MSEHHASSAKNGKSHSHRGKGAGAAKRSAAGAEAGEATGSERAEHALWRGSISFGLVQIPVSLSTAERSTELSFHQLDRRDQSPIHYDRINTRTGEKVAWGDIVKGYEIAKAKFVNVTDEDFHKANVEASQTIDILEFVDAGEIPPQYFERPYHLLPQGKRPKAYAVLRDAMAKKNLAAVALVVIRTRQHLAAVLPREDRLELELLRFAHDLREPPGGALKFPKPTAPEVQMAEHLIASMTGHWTPTNYRDTYRDELLKAIHQKAKTGVIEAKHVPSKGDGEAETDTDLLAMLQQSVKASAAKGAKHAAHAHHGAA